MIEPESYIVEGDEVRVAFRSVKRSGFRATVLSISSGEAGGRVFLLRGEETTAPAIRVREDQAVFTVRRGDAWISVPPLLTLAEATLKTARHGKNTAARIARAVPLFAHQVPVVPIVPQEWIRANYESAREQLEREDVQAFRATELRSRVQHLVTKEEFASLLARRERWSDGASYGIIFWQKQIDYFAEYGTPDLVQVPPTVAAKLSIPWLTRDARLRWTAAPGGPQAVRVLFIGSSEVLVRLTGEAFRDYDPGLIRDANQWLSPTDLSE